MILVVICNKTLLAPMTYPENKRSTKIGSPNIMAGSKSLPE